MDTDEKYMRMALRRAKKAADIGETPVGAVIVRDGRVIADGYNRRETKKDPLAHAELFAIRRAAKRLGGWRLTGCTLYVTLEPCPMCAGALIQARVERVVFGAYDKKAGSVVSVTDLFRAGMYNHDIEFSGGVLATECAQLLSGFFKELRGQKRAAEKQNI